MQKELKKASFCIDIGTSSLKAALISECGFVFSSTVVRFSPIQIENPYEISNCWINSFFQAGKNLQISNYKIQGISVSGNGPTLTAVNENSTFTILWNKEFSNSNIHEISELSKNSKSIFLPRLLYLKNLFPKIYEDAKAILSGPEFFINFLTNTQVTILPEKRFLPAYWTKEDLSEFNIDYNLLPDFVPIGFNSGFLRKEILAKFQIDSTEKIPVFCGGPDFVTALIGTNTLSVGKICDRSGSSEGINLCSNKPIFAEGFRNLPSVISDLHNVSFLLKDTGTRFTQWKNTSVWKENSYEECIIDLLKNKENSGYKLIFEIAKEVKNAFEKIILEKQKNLSIQNETENQIICTGGQAKNPHWMQFKSDVTNLELCVTNCPDAELMGNAIISNVGLQNYTSIQSAAKKMVTVTTKYVPKNSIL